jgi:hypothetical protein
MAVDMPTETNQNKCSQGMFAIFFGPMNFFSICLITRKTWHLFFFLEYVEELYIIALK